MFALAPASDAIFFLVCPTSHTYLYYTTVEKKKLAELLRLKGVAILKYFNFVGHGYLQHGECGWRGSHSLHYSTYLFLSLKNTVAFTSGSSVAVVEKHATGSGQKESEGDVGRTGGTSTDDKSKKEDSKNQDSTARSTNSAEGFDWKLSAASMPQD